MTKIQKTWTRRTDFEEAVKRRIVHRTGGRVETLDVKVIDNRIVIRGCVTSFHLKQRAIHGVFDVIRAHSPGAVEIDMQIVVLPRVGEYDVA
jgi:hypothetical protein